MEDNYPYIGVRITSKLKELGMTQVQLCSQTELSTTAMSAYCTGKRMPETTALYRIAKAFRTSMEWILTGEDVTIEDVANEDLRAQALGREKQILTCDGTPLDEDEIDMIAMRRLLPKEHQKELFDLTYFKYDRLVERAPAASAPAPAAMPIAEEPPRIPFAASGWPDITPEADSMIQEKLRQFEKRSLELKGKK